MRTPFHQTLVPLLLAPMGAMVVVSPIVLVGPYPTALLIYLFFVALVCYGAEIIFVVPVLLFWPRLRLPPLWLGSLSGVVVSWSVLGALALLPPAPAGVGQPFSWPAFLAGLAFLGACGLSSGVVYSLASRGNSIPAPDSQLSPEP